MAGASKVLPPPIVGTIAALFPLSHHPSSVLGWLKEVVWENRQASRITKAKPSFSPILSLVAGADSKVDGNIGLAGNIHLCLIDADI